MRDLAVVDVETTGLFNSDRVVEIAIVTVSGSGAVVDEFDTLINPERDVGPTHIHGVTASMVAPAPTFGEVAGAVAQRLDGNTLTCHNVAFDLRMLVNEFERVGATIQAGETACTLAASGNRLGVACSDRGVVLAHAHRALADARATAELAVLLSLGSDQPGMEISGIEMDRVVRTQRREATASPDRSPLRRIVETVHFPSVPSTVLSYFEALDWALDDHAMDPEEWQYLSAVAEYLAMSQAEVDVAHRSYMDALVDACRRDHIVTPEERFQMEAVADALLLEIDLPEVTELAAFQPEPGGVAAKVCFTGSATLPDGREITRGLLHELGEAHGFVPVATVTRKNCDVLVAADVATVSGKATRARKLGIPVISVDEFVTTHCASLSG